MTTFTRLVLAGWLCLPAACNDEPPEAPETPPAPAIEVATEESRVYAAPVSRLAGPAATSRPRPEEVLARRMTHTPRGQLHVVRGTVRALVAGERTFPAALYSESTIGTRAEVAVTRGLCGRIADGATVEVSYMAGRLDEARATYTSQMARDLVVGDAYVLVLRELEGEYFLETGMQDVFPAAGERATMRGLGELTDAQFQEVCP